MDHLVLILADSGTWALRPWVYTGFVGLVLGLLALDLGVFHRTAHVVGARESLIWTAVWVSCAMAFNVLVYAMYEGHWLGMGLDVPQLNGTVAASVSGLEAAEEFLTGYLVEYSLSMDNVFVIAVIFSSFGVPAEHRHRVLFWGVLGALVMRGLMIAVGGALIARFSWTTYVFGGLLFLTAAKLAFTRGGHGDPERHTLVRVMRRFFHVSPSYDGQRFLTRWEGRRAATPLLLALVVIEFTDLVFAVDSIPAIFAITADPFIVFTSNVFALMGLRSLYFGLAAMIDRFRYLKPSLIAVLAFVGVKMLLVKTEYKIDTVVSLAVVAGLLGLGVLASVRRPKSARATPGPSPGIPSPSMPEAATEFRDPGR